MKYRSRIIDKQIQESLKLFGAIAIEGPKWCGKTWSGGEAAKSYFYLADPSHNFYNRQLVKYDVSNAFAGDYPHLIDEWQEVPEIWDAVRHMVDQSGERGCFILTGSSTPNDNATIHSGTGRISRVQMSTMSFQELGISTHDISLGKLLAGTVNNKLVKKSSLTLDNLLGYICKGGWPDLLEADDESSTKILRKYVKSLVEADCTKIDGVKRNPAKINALLQSLSRNTATLVKKQTIAKDIASYDSLELSRNTIDSYLNVLRRLFILQEIPAWHPELKSTIRMRSLPKRILVDQSLAVASLGCNATFLKNDLKLAGNLFENLVFHDLLIYAQANEAKVYHYHDDSDYEVDAIIESMDGSWGAIEIKLGYDGEEEGAKNLLQLESKLDKSLQVEAKFLAVIVGIGGILHKREDGIWVIPLDCLGE